MKTKKTNKPLVPALRFPEFKEDGEWEEKRLEKLCFKISDGIHSTPKYDDSGEYYFVNGNNLVNGIIVINESTKKVSKEEFEKHKRELGGNTILLSINGTIGNLSEYSGEKVVLGKSACYINVNEDKVEKKFILYCLKTEVVRKYFYAELTGSTIKNLSLKTIKNTTIKLPSPKEQQKIADCLYSLDQLMGVHEARLERLQNHKKGLMQQLFPQEGEKVPRLRFPEFKGDGEWERKTLDECLQQKPEYGMNAPAVPYSASLPTYLRITDISEDGHYLSDKKVSVDKEVTEENYLQDGDIVLARTGASVGKSYKYRPKDGKLVFAGFLIRVRPDKTKLNSELLFQYLATGQYWKWVGFTSMRSGQPGINGKEYSSMPLSLPPTLAEQQKIANCLSSLDTLIAAEAQKIGALGKHKKGLMQQLFPEINR
ncbi:restriction endonuclease subunit S [uncultured Microscilla sp.]|uniref:restriction endonuclease subunit S n=1 Tax=uncultured Microscilla sp. TaxID=432653 RepID=UPI00260FCAF8|nr:restriction endonuclease subunit S [uncultured Microscilla sp.]